MTKPHRRFQAAVESLEGKALMSAIPTVSASTLNSVLKQIDRAAGTYAKTHNAAQFDKALAQISYKVPYGHASLFPTWQDTETIYDASVPGSGLQMVKQLKVDLKDYIQSSVADGTIRIRGSWAGVSAVASAASTTTGFAPLLTNKTYLATLKQIDRAAGTYAKTHNAAQFDRALAQISYKVPYGHAALYPTWQDTETIYDASVPGSGVTMVRQLKADLKDYVHTAVADGTIRFR